MISRTKRALLVALALFFSCISVYSDPATHDEKPLRILFVGNSYIYYNNLPEILAKLGEAGHQKKVEYTMLAPGGWRLSDHWEHGQFKAALQSTKYDYVVLQDQSQLGDNTVVDGKPRITTDENFRPYALDMVKAIQQAGAIPVLYVTWAKKAVPEDQAALTNAYMKVAKETKSVVAPVGVAWAEIRTDAPEIELFVADGSHPSQAGSYLAACVFYATIFGRSPEGLPAQVIGTPMNLTTEKPDTGKTAVLINLKPQVARKLQESAWQTSVKVRLNGGYLMAPVAQAPVR